MELKLSSKNMSNYLIEPSIIDFSDEKIRRLARNLKEKHIIVTDLLNDLPKELEK